MPPAQGEAACDVQSSSRQQQQSPCNPRAHQEERSCQARGARAELAPPGPEGNTLLVGTENTSCQRTHRVSKTLLNPKGKGQLAPGAWGTT